LPRDVVYHTHTDFREVAKAIRDTIVRGAPAPRGRHEMGNSARDEHELLVRSDPGGMTVPANIFGSPLGGAEPCNRTGASTNLRKIPDTTHRFLSRSPTNLISLRMESPLMHILTASCTECES
jgi:hypothetical protein